MKFFLPEQWEENKDGIRYGPYVYMGKVVSNNPYPMSAKGEYDFHHYLHYCTRFLVYDHAKIVDDAIDLGPQVVRRGLRPFGSHRFRAFNAVDPIIPTEECGGNLVFKEGMLYDYGVIWANEGGDGVPEGISREKPCSFRSETEFKLKSTGELGGFWWNPAGSMGSLWDKFKARYPACLAEGDEFCLLLYVEAWAGILEQDRFNPWVIGTTLKKQSEESVDLWVTAFFM